MNNYFNQTFPILKQFFYKLVIKRLEKCPTFLYHTEEIVLLRLIKLPDTSRHIAKLDLSLANVVYFDAVLNRFFRLLTELFFDIHHQLYTNISTAKPFKSSCNEVLEHSNATWSYLFSYLDERRVS